MAFALGVAASPSHSVAPVDRSYRLMGSSLEIRVFSDSRSQGLAAADAVWKAVDADERRLSTWISDSELSQVNRAPVGKLVPLSSLSQRDLKNAVQCAARTDFAFTPWIGPMVRAWGLRQGGKIPAESERRSAWMASQSGAFTLTDQGIIKNRVDSNIEEGGFGKGAALDDALAALTASGIRDAVLNFGGQVSILGAQEVSIELADPSRRDHTLLRFDAGEGSVATSSNSVHGMKVHTPKGETQIGHLLDPRTGRPAPYDGSVTILAATGAEADCLSKIFVVGASQGLQWARKHHVQALFIMPASKPGRWIARTSCDWKPHLTSLSPQIEIQPDC